MTVMMRRRVLRNFPAASAVRQTDAGSGYAQNYDDAHTWAHLLDTSCDVGQLVFRASRVDELRYLQKKDRELQWPQISRTTSNCHRLADLTKSRYLRNMT